MISRVLEWWTIQDSNLRRRMQSILLAAIIQIKGSQVRTHKKKKTGNESVPGKLLVDDTGLEPVTLRTSSGCSYQLS